MTSIAKILEERFKNSLNSSEFGLCHYTQPMTLDILQKIDKNYAYVTDGTHTIMAIHGKRKDQINCYPFNRLSNPFYNFDKKVHLYLNFHNVTDHPSKYQIHPYNPHYYFKDDYNDFLQYREAYKIQKPMQRLIIHDWSVGIVNITNTGYYAPVIVYQKYSKQSNFNQIPKYMEISCILFEPFIQNMLERYRLQDTRRIEASKFPPQTETSLFYFLRYKRKTTNKIATILSIDHSQHLLKFNKQSPYSFTLIGQAKGPCSIINPLKKEMDYKQIEQFNVHQLAMVFKNMAFQDPLRQKLFEKPTQIIPEKDLQESHNHSYHNPLDFESQSEQDDDPLRNIYTKKLMQINKQKLKPEGAQH